MVRCASAVYHASSPNVLIHRYVHRSILNDPQVYPEPDELKPERWLDSEGSANKNPRNYLVFGSGPHKCIGLEYAMSNIALVLADASLMLNWEHEITPKSDKVQ